MEIKNPKAVAMLKRLESGGFAACLAGGCVRDLLMGREPADYDVATAATPAQTREVFSDCAVIDTGIRHGTVTVLYEGEAFEITTFRRDGTYSDARRPDSVCFSDSFFDDAARRDFTINALGCDIRGEVMDFYGGVDDIKNGIIRCVGEPEKRFSEDPLRIIRAVRFCSTLGFRPEEKTEKAMFACRGLLLGVSGERVAAELLKTLCGQNVKSALCGYVEIWGVLIPELLPMKGFEHKNPWHIYDVLTHTAVAVESCPDDPVVRLAALFHDIGKPEVFFLNDEGRGRFIGHAEKSVVHAAEIMGRLHIGKATAQRVFALVKYHDVSFDDISRAGIKRYLGRLGADGFFDLIALKRADAAAQSERAAYRKGILDGVEQTARELLAAGECVDISQLAVGGKELLEIGYLPGPAVGDMLAELVDAVIEGKLENEREALLRYAARRSAKK